MQERREELQIEGEKAKRYHVLWNGEIVGQHFRYGGRGGGILSTPIGSKVHYLYACAR
jgi:hypothetical protein